MPSDPIVHVIDDDDAARDSLAFLLETSGFPVQTYASAVAFLDQIADAEPGCIVSDMRMPGMDGIQLLSRIKALSPDTIRVMLTGNADMETAINAINEGSIFRFVFWHSVALAAIVGTIVMLYAYVFPQFIPHGLTFIR